MADRKDDWQDVAKGLQAKAAPRPPAVGSVMVDAAQEIVRLRALVEDLSLKLIAAEQAARAAGEERDALRRFKAYVHRRLDEAGVPADPDSPHKAEGCRIGGRLDLVLARWAEAEEIRAWLKDRKATAHKRADDAKTVRDEFGRAVEEAAYTAVLLKLDRLAPPSPVAGGPGAADKSTEYQQVAALVCSDLDVLYNISKQLGTTLEGLRAQVKLAHKNKEQYINDPAARERRYAAGCVVFGAAASGLLRSDVVSGGPGGAEMGPEQ